MTVPPATSGRWQRQDDGLHVPRGRRQERPRQHHRRRRRHGHHDEGDHRRRRRQHTPPGRPTAPNTTITSGPTGTTTDNTPTFAFTATESGHVPVPARRRRLGSVHQPVDHERPDRRHARHRGARHGRGRQHRRHTRDAVVHRRRGGAPQTLIGDSTVQSTPDSNGAGTAETFKATASASGTTTKMSVSSPPATPPARWWSGSTATPTAIPGRC